MPRDVRYTYVSHHPWNAAEPFAAFAEQGWLLRISCWSCGHAAVLDGAALVRSHGAGASVGRIYKALTCSCGARWPIVDTVRLRPRP